MYQDYLYFYETIMKTKLFIKSIAVFFFVLFAGTKILSVHDLLHNHDHHSSHAEHDYDGVYGHIDHNHHDHEKPQGDTNHEEDCDLCDKILLDLFSPYSEIGQSSDLTEVSQHFYKKNIEEYTSVTHTTELSSVLFSRPPPSLN